MEGGGKPGTGRMTRVKTSSLGLDMEDQVVQLHATATTSPSTSTTTVPQLQLVQIVKHRGADEVQVLIEYCVSGYL